MSTSTAVTSLATAARLVVPVAVFAGLGALAGRAFPALWHERAGGVRTVHRILLGQVLLVLWLYARSAVNHLTGFVLPLGGADALALGAILLAVSRARRPPRPANPRAWLAEPAVTLGVIAIAIGITAWNELPRLVMLSSDPDQHAFMARQIQRLGTLPWFSQGAWGTRDFRYPGGFAVLNFAWASLSGVDVRDVVQVQTAVQAQLALLLLMEAALRPRDEARAPVRALAGLLMIGVFYRVLPYGYQDGHYHLEGAGRTACLFLLSGGLALAVESVRAIRGGERAASASLAADGAFLAASLATAGLINLVMLPWLAVVVVLALLPHLARAPLRAAAATVLVLSAAAAALLLDPYYVQRLFHPERLHSVAAQLPPAVTLSARGLLAETWHQLAALSRAPFWVDGLSPGVFTGWAGPRVLGTLAALVAVLAALRAATLREAIAPIILVGSFLAVRALAVPLSLTLAASTRDSYLLPSYLEQVREQLVYLVAAALGATAIAACLRSRRLVRVAGIAAVAGALALLPRPSVRAFARQPYAGSLGVPTQDDLRAIADLEGRYAAWLGAHRGAPFGSIPKILLPNLVLRTPQENWLFPYGGARIVPLYDVFPTAFFYFMGSDDYTFRQYCEHVCERFDVEWLASRGIKYLFLPADRGEICVAGGTRVPPGARAVAVFGDAVVAEIGP